MAKKKSKAGRKKIKFNLDNVEAFGAVKASYQFMADYFECSKKTIARRMLKEEDDFCLRYKKGLAKTKYALAEKQIEVALKGNTTMLIWLGKQLLEQRDEQKMEHSGNLTLATLFNTIKNGTNKKTDK